MKKLAPRLIGFFLIGWAVVKMLPPRPTSRLDIVGLHSYGFMDQAFGVLLAFIASQLVIIGLGLLPHRYWRGIQARNVGVSDGATAAPAVVTAT